MPKIPKWAKNVARVCMGIRPGERVLLITDRALKEQRRALRRAIRRCEPAELVSWVLPEEERPLGEAPSEILEAMRTFEVGLMFLAHADLDEQPFRISLIRAVNEGGRMRYAAGLNMDESIFENELAADYRQVADITYLLEARLRGSTAIRVMSPLGTDLTLSAYGREICADPGLIRRPGYNNLPAGECFFAPVEGSAEGTLVVDCSFPGVVIDKPIRLTLEGGRVINISGDTEAKKLKKIIRRAEKLPNGENTRNVAEFGIGTNPAARITGKVITDEKVMGTIHIAIGHNAMPPYNGQNVAPIHLDFVMDNPTLVVDGEVLIDNGEYLA